MNCMRQELDQSRLQSPSWPENRSILPPWLSTCKIITDRILHPKLWHREYWSLKIVYTSSWSFNLYTGTLKWNLLHCFEDGMWTLRRKQSVQFQQFYIWHSNNIIIIVVTAPRKFELFVNEPNNASHPCLIRGHSLQAQDDIIFYPIVARSTDSDVSLHQRKMIGGRRLCKT